MTSWTQLFCVYRFPGYFQIPISKNHWTSITTYIYRTIAQSFASSLAYFCPNLVAMVTLLAPWNFCYHVWIHRPRKPYYSCEKIPRFLAQNWNQCNFGLLLPRFDCHGNSLGFLENFVYKCSGISPRFRINVNMILWRKTCECSSLSVDVQHRWDGIVLVAPISGIAQH